MRFFIFVIMVAFSAGAIAGDVSDPGRFPVKRRSDKRASSIVSTKCEGEDFCDHKYLYKVLPKVSVTFTAPSKWGLGCEFCQEFGALSGRNQFLLSGGCRGLNAEHPILLPELCAEGSMDFFLNEGGGASEGPKSAEEALASLIKGRDVLSSRTKKIGKRTVVVKTAVGSASPKKLNMASSTYWLIKDGPVSVLIAMHMVAADLKDDAVKPWEDGFIEKVDKMISSIEVRREK